MNKKVNHKDAAIVFYIQINYFRFIGLSFRDFVFHFRWTPENSLQRILMFETDGNTQQKGNLTVFFAPNLHNFEMFPIFPLQNPMVVENDRNAKENV